jgi:hypothetical protein
MAFCLHTWAKWTDREQGVLMERAISDPKSENRMKGIVIIQERRCTKCGMLQLRSETSRRWF